MSHRRYDVLLLVVCICAGAAYWAVTHVPSGVVVREPLVDERARAYLTEVARLPKTRRQPPIYSPDSRWILADTLARDSYHTVRVLDARTRALLPVVTLRESDPGSGRSFLMIWSADSRALIIRGHGAFWRQENQDICLVYLPAERELLTPGSCV